MAERYGEGFSRGKKPVNVNDSHYTNPTFSLVSTFRRMARIRLVETDVNVQTPPQQGLINTMSEGRFSPLAARLAAVLDLGRRHWRLASQVPSRLECELHTSDCSTILAEARVSRTHHRP